MQLTFILQQIGGLIPQLSTTLRATVDRANEHAAFSVELFDLHTWTMRPLASALNFSWRPEPALVRYIARLTVLEVAGVAIFKTLNLSHGYWLPLTILVVMQPDYGSTRLRAGQRVFGTLAGGVLASLLLWLALPKAVLVTAMAVTMFWFAFFLKRNYGYAVFFITLFVVLITETSAKVTLAFTGERLGATAAGIGVSPQQGGVPGNLVIVDNTVLKASGDAIHLSGVAGPILVADNALYAQAGNAIFVNGTTAMVTSIGNVGSGALNGIAGGFDAGGDLATDFGAASWSGAPPQDLVPRNGRLVGSADAATLARDDFNGVPRYPQRDVGAYRANPDGKPGWVLQAGFKTVLGIFADGFER